MKKWHSKSFSTTGGEEVLTEKVLAFANRKKLLPAELVVIKQWTSNDGALDRIQILYYSASKTND